MVQPAYGLGPDTVTRLPWAKTMLGVASTSPADRASRVPTPVLFIRHLSNKAPASGDLGKYVCAPSYKAAFWPHTAKFVRLGRRGGERKGQQALKVIERIS